MKDSNSIPLLTFQGTLRVSSLTIAEKLEKPHKNILRSLESVGRECSESFWRLNFEPRDYEMRGKSYPMYDLTKDGFTLLMMKFSGPKASAWRERFIAAFNAMENFIRDDLQLKARQIARQGRFEWQQARHSGKLIRRQTTDGIKAFASYATDRGSQNGSRYYMAITKMIGTALFGGTVDRDSLNEEELSILELGELVCSKTLLNGMGLNLPYKEIFQTAKTQVSVLGAMINHPGHCQIKPTLAIGG